MLAWLDSLSAMFLTLTLGSPWFAGRLSFGLAQAALTPFGISGFDELVINLKTAKALGLSVPLTLQVAADEVIE